jgi:N-acetylglucosamine kinase-like BadF-type ATPase
VGLKTAVILAADGGNSKTELLAATRDGEVLAYRRGPGSNSHAIGADGTAAVLHRLVGATGVELPGEAGVFYLCGADVPADIEELTAAVAAHGWVRRAAVDNDTFALLRVGTDASDAVAVVCGAGMNCVGRAAGGRTIRYPALGWETGDWGGSEPFGREALHLAARGEDGRGEPTVLGEAIRGHFGLTTGELGEAIHYRRLRESRLGELAPLAIAAAAAGDAVARGLVERQALEVALVVRRALRDLGLESADVVLGGGMLAAGEGYLYERTLALLTELAPGARPLPCAAPPVLGAALAALDLAGAPLSAAERLRQAFRDGLRAEAVA